MSSFPSARRIVCHGPMVPSMRCSPSISGILLPTARQHVHRVLKPGGVFVSKTPCLAEMTPLIRLAVPVMQLVGKAPYVAIFSASALEQEIETAGFTIVERARHGAGRKDARIFIVARKAGEPGSFSATP